MEKKTYFMQQWAPTTARVCEQDVKLLFSLGAAADMETQLQTDYPAIVCEFLRIPTDGSNQPASPMTLKRQAVVIACMMRAAGEDIAPEDLIQLHMTDFAALSKAAGQEMLLKSPTAKKKPSPANQT